MRRRLTLVIHSLDGGGAEKTMATMANRWTEMGHEVTLITLDSAANDRYKVGSSVRRVGLGLMSCSKSKLEAIWKNVVRLRELRRAIVTADGNHVISFTNTMNILCLLTCRKHRVIICERVDPRQHPIGKAWSLLRKLAYPRCLALVVQTDAVREHMRPVLKGRPIFVLPNFVAKCESATNRERVVVAMGRLVRQKGFDLLIDAFKQIAAKHPGWRLLIYGDGPERQSLETQISSYNLSEFAQIAGWTDSPQVMLGNAEMFVLSSRYEGFPNALLEAMAAGTAVVSFDCESGPREIIRDEVDGLLIPPQDVSSLAVALDRLMSDDEERKRLAGRAMEVTQRFTVEAFFDSWDRILDMCMSTNEVVS